MTPKIVCLLVLAAWLVVVCVACSVVLSYGPAVRALHHILARRGESHG
ncbi:hypothetical protein [Azospirillum argentinense]